MSDWPNIARPVCAACRRATAVEEDYERYEPGRGEHLCWEDAVDCGVVAGGVIPALEAERDCYREALEFYADESHWLDGAAGEWIVEPGSPVSGDGFAHDEFEHDNGERARAALSRNDQPEDR